MNNKIQNPEEALVAETQALETHNFAIDGHEYCYCKRGLGWMNQGMVAFDKQDWWANYHLTTPDRQYGPATEVAFIKFCIRDNNFMPESTIRELASKSFKGSTVMIISIWSKCPQEGYPENVRYAVTVMTGKTPRETLENAFSLTNKDDRPNPNHVCSTSSGDIMVLDGQHYLVENVGFKEITEAESEKIAKLTSRETSMGYNWLVSFDKERQVIKIS
jgi:hypothetical protein